MVIFDPDTEEHTVQPRLERHLRWLPRVAALSTSWTSANRADSDAWSLAAWNLSRVQAAILALSI